MELFIATLFATTTTLLGVFFLLRYFFHKLTRTHLFYTQQLTNSINDVNKAVANVHKRIDQIFIIDQPAENQVARAQTEDVEFNEQNILDIPKDIKFEVEGGSGMEAPPEFEIR